MLTSPRDPVWHFSGGSSLDRDEILLRIRSEIGAKSAGAAGRSKITVLVSDLVAKKISEASNDSMSIVGLSAIATGEQFRIVKVIDLDKSSE